MADIRTLTVNLVVAQDGGSEVLSTEKKLKLPERDISTLETEIMIRIESLKKEIELLEKNLPNEIELKRQTDIASKFDIALILKKAISGELFAELDVLIRNFIESDFSAFATKSILEFVRNRLKGRLEVEGERLDPQLKKNIEEAIKLVEKNIESINQQIPEKAEKTEIRNDPRGKRIQNIIDTINAKKEELKKLQEMLNEDQRLFNDDGISPQSEKLLKNNQNLTDSIDLHKDFIGVVKLTQDELFNLSDKYALLTNENGIYKDAAKQATETTADLINNGINPLTGKASELGISLEDLFQNTSDGAVIFGLTKEELSGLRDATDEATKSAENLGENGFTAVKENVEQAGNKLGTLDTNLMNVADRNKDVADSQDQVNQSLDDGTVAFDNVGASAEEFGDTLEQVESSGGFFEGIKQGFIDFVENVQSNSELMADFFADTLSQMSQSFSDLFFNIITGKFDDLKDLAKQAFEAILRAFLDLVSAIATRQIVISIGGLFGIGKGAQAAGGGGNPADIAQQGAGVVGSGLGLFGSGGAFSTLGQGLGLISPGIGLTGEIGPLGVPIIGELAGPGFLATAGAAITVIGAVLAVAALAFTFIAPLLKKTPRFAFKFESVETEVGERAAVVKEFLDADFFSEEIFRKIVGRGGKGAFSGKEVDDLKKSIQKAIEETINSVQDIINKLPKEMADLLNEALLNTTVDTETKIGRSNLLGFDAKGAKEIKERLEKFFQGDLQGRFLFAIRDFFQIAFEQLGVLPDKAAAFIDTEFERFKNAKSPEERAQIGQEFLASFNAFVDAFNIVSGNVNDAIGQTIQSVRSLSQELGFDAVPSIGELKDKLGELLENAELDPETVQKYADLRNAIVQGISDIINSITGLIGKISQLNSTIVGLGGAAVNIIPFLDEAQAKLVDFYTTNIGNLSLGEQETFLDEILGIANAKLAEEQAAFQRAQEARQKAEEAQRERIEKRIDNLNKEKDKINEVFQKRIEALNEELQIAESFAQLTESIRQTLDSILFSPESVLTGVEQVNALQSNIANLQAQLTSAVDPEKQLEIAGRLEEAFKTLFDTAGDAFGVNSPEFVAIFDQVTGGLENLADFTGERGRSVEEISAEIERLTAENEATLKSIDAKIEAAQERLASIGQSTADNTFRASQELTELFEFIRSEYIRILEERFAELGEVSEFGFATEVEGLGVIAGFTEESLTVLKGVGEEAAKHTGLLTEIADRLAAVAGFQGGTGGFRDFGRGKLAILHGLEAVVTKRDIAAVQDSILHQIAGGGISGLADRLAGERDGRDGLSRGGFIAGMRPGGGFMPEFPLSGVRPSPDEPVNHVTEMSVDINVNVDGGSQASIASLAGEIENMMVRSIRQGRVRKELQEAAVRRVG